MNEKRLVSDVNDSADAIARVKRRRCSRVVLNGSVVVAVFDFLENEICFKLFVCLLLQLLSALENTHFQIFNDKQLVPFLLLRGTSDFQPKNHGPCLLEPQADCTHVILVPGGHN